MMWHDLWWKRSYSVLNQFFAVIQVYWNRHIINNFKCFIQGNLKSIWYRRSMDSFCQKVLSCSQQCSCNYDNRCCTVSSFNILSFADFNELQVKYIYYSCWFFLKLTILAVGWITSICLRIVAPSFVIRTLPLVSWI
jgi:hypothetical protein